jgi:anthranilate synthase/aminodeoxychorismate synthase-like glutamine amidotransferase
MILMIDNYDSFTYNLVQYLGELGQDLRVVRNDDMSADELVDLAPSKVVVSPGPCTPAEAGVSVEAIRRFAGHVPLLGVCLGHQSVGAAFGAQVVRAQRIMHGKTSMIRHNGEDVFQDLSQPFEATRYHSLVLEQSSLPECFEVTATAEDDGEIMGVRHRELPVWGVQFHPESILTHEGKSLLGNFLALN